MKLHFNFLQELRSEFKLVQKTIIIQWSSYPSTRVEPGAKPRQPRSPDSASQTHAVMTPSVGTDMARSVHGDLSLLWHTLVRYYCQHPFVSKCLGGLLVPGRISIARVRPGRSNKRRFIMTSNTYLWKKIILGFVSWTLQTSNIFYSDQMSCPKLYWDYDEWKKKIM